MKPYGQHETPSSHNNAENGDGNPTSVQRSTSVQRERATDWTFWFHLSLFYPPAYVGEAYTRAATVTAVSTIVGGPLAALLMQLDGSLGMRGWQWLFLLEGLPCVGFAFVVWKYLPLDIKSSTFLSKNEKKVLNSILGHQPDGQRLPDEGDSNSEGHERRNCDDMRKRQALEVERDTPHAAPPEDLRSVLTRVLCCRKLYHLGLMWGFAECTLYGVIFWLPLIIRDALGEDSGGSPQSSGHGEGIQGAGLVAFFSAIPFFAAVVSMLWVARRSVVMDERRKHCYVSLYAGAVCMMAASCVDNKFLTFIMLTGAAAGVWAIHGPFMSWPSMCFVGTEKAPGIALINSMGAIGGFFGPSLIGVLSEGSTYSTAYAVLGLLLFASATLALIFQEPEQDVGRPQRP